MDSRANQENTVSIDLGHKTIYLYNLLDRDNPIELAFQPKYQLLSWSSSSSLLLLSSRFACLC